MEINLNQFITTIIYEADNAVDEFLFNAYTNLVNNNIEVFTSLLVIYVVITGVRGIYYGFAMSDIFTPILKMAFVYALATTWPYFHDYIYSFLVQIPNEIIKAFGTPGADGAYGLNTVFVKGFEIVTRLFEAGGWSAIHYYILAFVVLIVNLGVMVAGLGGILVAKFLLAIYLFLSPIFLMLFLFESTRSMTESWVQQLITVTLWPILICAVLLLSLQISERIMIYDVELLLESRGAVSLAFQFISFQTLTAFLLSQVPSKAAALAGGVMLSGYRGAVQSTREFTSNSKSALASANKAGGSTVAKIAKGAVAAKGAAIAAGVANKSYAAKTASSVASRLHG